MKGQINKKYNINNNKKSIIKKSTTSKFVNSKLHSNTVSSSAFIKLSNTVTNTLINQINKKIKKLSLISKMSNDHVVSTSAPSSSSSSSSTSFKNTTYNVVKILIHFQQYTSLTIKDISNYLNCRIEHVAFIIEILYILEIIQKDNQDDDHYNWIGFGNEFKETIEYCKNSKSNFITNHSEINCLNNYTQQQSNNNNNNNNRDIGSMLHQFIKNLLNMEQVSISDLKNNNVFTSIDSTQFNLIKHISKIFSVLGLMEIIKVKDSIDSFKWIAYKP